MKKFLAMLITLAMVITLLPATLVSAEDTTAAFESIGTPFMRSQIISYAVTKKGDTPVLVGVSSGNPATLVVVDLSGEMKVINTHEVPNGKTFYAYAVDKNGDVWFAGYSKPLTLYKYSPTDDTLTAVIDDMTVTKDFLGITISSYTPKAICDITVDDNNNIYLGTYDDSHILKWDGSELTDLGTVYEDDDYCKTLAYYNGSLWAGGEKEGSALVEYNLSTNEKTSYPLDSIMPEGVTSKSLYQGNVVGDKMFVFTKTNSSNYLTVFDLTNKKWVQAIEGGNGAYALASADGTAAYFSKVENGESLLMKYDLATDTYAQSNFTGHIGGIHTKNSMIIDGKTHIYYVATSNNYITDVCADDGGNYQATDILPNCPDQLESFMVDSEGYIYVSPYQGGFAIKYNPDTKAVEETITGIGQASVIEEIDGKIYFATYPACDLVEYDPIAKTTKTLFAFADENQGRPMDIVKAGDKLVVATIGGYGDADNNSSGCVIVYDTTTGHWTKYKGGDFENYHMTGLYYHSDGRCFVTTTVVGGHNSTQEYKNAIVFDFYPGKEAITEDSTVEFSDEVYINQATISGDTFDASGKNVAMCGGLAKDPNADKLWCVCYNGIFSMDMGNLSVVDKYTTGDIASISRWKPYFIEFDSKGDLYAAPDDKLYKLTATTADGTTTYSSPELIKEGANDAALRETTDGLSIYTLADKANDIYISNKQAVTSAPALVDGYYQITSFEDFKYIAKEPSAKYKLVNDIQVGTADAPFTAPFEFSGELDGNGKTITAYIQAADQSVGLFSGQSDAAKGVTIKNLTLNGKIERTNGGGETSKVTVANNVGSVGGFLGYSEQYGRVLIENCVNNAEIVGNAAANVGGIVGNAVGFALENSNDGVVIKNCTNNGAVSGMNYAAANIGGIAGRFGGIITDSVNVGTLTGKGTYIGGIVGTTAKQLSISQSCNFGNVTTAYAFGAGGMIGIVWTSIENPTISNSFNAGNVTNSYTGDLSGAGGIIGRGETDTSDISLNSCYNSGTITCGKSTQGNQVVGYSGAGITATNVYYVSGTNGVSGANEFGEKTALAEIGFDESVWTWDADAAYKYPLLKGLSPETGTADFPYLVENEADFMAIKNNPSAYYKLANDIQIGTADAPFTAPFEFSGVLDGQGHTITAYITAANQAVGLFSTVSDGAKGIEIKNLTLNGRIERTADASNNSDELVSAVGGFLGSAENYAKIYITNCVNNAEIIGNNAKSAGGIVGRTFGWKLTSPNDCLWLVNCTNNGSVSATASAFTELGGIVGNGSGTITGCVNTGTISGKGEYVGGIVGRMVKAGEMSECANLGNINVGHAYGCGGLVGISTDEAGLTIKNSFNAGDVSSTYNNTSMSSASGLVGRGWGDTSVVTIEDCYNVGKMTNVIANRANQICAYNADKFVLTDVWYADGEYAHTAAKKFGDNNTLAAIGFDENVWEWDIDGVYGYPVLKGINTENGSDKFPYIVETKEDFLAIKNNPTATYYIANDIDLGEYEPFEFKGHLIGAVDKETGEYVTLNVDINMPETLGVGLFSRIDGYVRIENIKVTGSILGGGMTGGFAGIVGTRDSSTDTLIPGSYIKNCINEANVTSKVFTGSSDYQNGRTAGGIVGYYRSGNGRIITLTNLENRGNITVSKSYAGGIAGNMKGIASNCVNTGHIYGSNCVGGIAGFAFDDRKISNSYNTGLIEGDESIGGIVGRWQHPGTSGNDIENCYNAGEILASDIGATGNVGSLVGNVIGTGGVIMANAYNAGKVNGSYSGAAIGTSETDPTLTNVYSLTVNGDADETDSTVGIAGLEALELSGFEKSATAYPFPQITGNINNNALSVLMIENKTCEEADGTASASVDMATNLSDKKAVLVVAVYDTDGTLISVKRDEKAIGKAKTSFSTECAAEEGQTVRAFLWDAGQVPYCGSWAANQ